jgi:hypothetical protein
LEVNDKEDVESADLTAATEKPQAGVSKNVIKKGDIVVINKAGSQNGAPATVVDPNWGGSGRVKVKMHEDGADKSYTPDELEKSASIPLNIPQAGPSSSPDEFCKGDAVVIIKTGSFHGFTATVVDSNWSGSGRVKVKVHEDGSFKSYTSEDLRRAVGKEVATAAKLEFVAASKWEPSAAQRKCQELASHHILQYHLALVEALGSMCTGKANACALWCQKLLPAELILCVLTDQARDELPLEWKVKRAYSSFLVKCYFETELHEELRSSEVPMIVYIARVLQILF